MAPGAAQKLVEYGTEDGQVGDMDTTDITRITKIGISHSSRQFGYIDALIVHYQRLGQEESTSRWGGPGGQLTEITLQANEYITAIKGHHSGIVRSLKLETNVSTYGPYGSEEATPFELSALGGQIIGFHTRYGDYLNSIGAYIKATDGNATEVKQKELKLDLYLEQNIHGGSQNQAVVVNPNLSNLFGVIAINDWAVLDGRGPGAKVVARAQGLHVGSGWNREQWYCSHNIMFEDDRYKGSSLEVRGQWDVKSPFEWAIVGGTGQFTLAQGIIKGEEVSSDTNTRIAKLFIHAFYRPMQ